jgi:hypothetical protein
MASPSIRKTLSPLVAVALLTVPAEAQVSYTGSSGYVQVTLTGSALTAVSATLQNKSDHTSNVTINADWVPTVPQVPPTPDIPAQQTATATGAAWTVDQWAGYFFYVGDSTSGEEAFLILSNTADTVTFASRFDLLDAARSIPAVTSASIRAAQTIGGLLGSGPGTPFTVADKIYLWNGTGWTTYFYVPAGPALGWHKIGSVAVVDDDAVFPGEGLFVLLAQASDIVLTFFGDVPSKAQVTTMPGPGLQFVSMRYPVDTTVGELGFHNLPDWNRGGAGDLLYLWNGAGWTTYFYLDAIGPLLAGWRKIGSVAIVDTDPVGADTAVFTSRKGISSLAESANFHALPYPTP